MKLAFRPATSDADRTFVVESMLSSQRTSYSAGIVAVDCWFETMRPHFVKAMQRPGMRTVVAYEQTDPDFVYGFISADPSEQRIVERDDSVRWWPALVLYLFVKQNYRRQGIARRLFREVGVNPDKPFLYSMNTQQASRLSAKAPYARFNPLVIRHPKETV